MDISGKLNQVNGRLRESRVRVRVEQAGNKLRLRATLPPKPDSNRPEPHQQRISPGLSANLDGLRQAEKLARLISSQLETGQFSWADWILVSLTRQISAGETISQFEQHYLSNGGSITTWRGDYLKILRRIPPDAPIEPGILTAVAEQTRPNTRSRQRACMALAALAKFAGVEWDNRSLRGNYSPNRVDPRDIPEDALIAECREGISNEGWRWVYGMMATYGIRNHEAFHADIDAYPIVRIDDQTKTGSREVWPCFPEWAEDWRLQEKILPPVDLVRANEKIGHSVTRYLSPLIPFRPYDLRHAWAIRTLLFGWPVELAARQMGHSVEIHTRTYHRWINREHQQRVYDLLVSRPDRPLPPR